MVRRRLVIAAAGALLFAVTGIVDVASAATVPASRLTVARIIGIRQSEAVARVGDVNGDHRPDVAVADYNSVKVVFAPRGGWRGTIDVRRIGSHGFTIKGAPGGGLGMFLDGAGDFNGDGLRDVLVTSLFAYPDEFGGRYDPAQRPEFIVVFGKRDTRTVDLANLRGRARIIELPLHGTGTAAGVGDVNGDGFDDVIAAQAYGTDGLQPGAYVVFGGRATHKVDLAKRAFPGFFIKTPGHYWVWRSVEAAGDQNGDGLADVVVGPAGGKPVYVVFGKRDRAIVDTARLGRHGFTLAPTVALAWQAGDVNDDGRTDLLGFGDFTFKGRQNAGGAFVMFGRRPPLRADLMSLGSRGLTIGGRVGEHGCEPAPDANIVDCRVENEGLGRGSSMGDLNGDGLGDLALGTMRANRMYVIHGRRHAATIDLAALHGRDYAITGPSDFGMSDKIAWIGARKLAVLGSGRHGQEVRILALRG